MRPFSVISRVTGHKSLSAANSFRCAWARACRDARPQPDSYFLILRALADLEAAQASPADDVLRVTQPEPQSYEPIVVEYLALEREGRPSPLLAILPDIAANLSDADVAVAPEVVERHWVDVASSLPGWSADEALELGPYEFRWLVPVG